MTSEINFIADLPLFRWEEYKKLRLQALQEAPQAFASTYQSASEKPDVEWQQSLERYLEGKTNWMVFAEKNHQLVGMVGAFQTSDDENQHSAHIIAMYVAPEERGRGIATKLLSYLLTKLKIVGLEKVTLEANTGQKAAVELYKSLDFKILAEHTEVRENDTEFKVYTMEKQL
jgi:ribosomal protein S18 acetylase RimI-like enzyme